MGTGLELFGSVIFWIKTLNCFYVSVILKFHIVNLLTLLFYGQNYFVGSLS